jgi:TetR/AcrR family transcriptional repressor of lmrAB and yxaGH operons
MARKVADRGDVIAALAKTFHEHGYAGASLSEITARTGLGRDSLYHFFPDGKEGWPGRRTTRGCSLAP